MPKITAHGGPSNQHDEYNEYEEAGPGLSQLPPIASALAEQVPNDDPADDEAGPVEHVAFAGAAEASGESADPAA